MKFSDLHRLIQNLNETEIEVLNSSFENRDSIFFKLFEFLRALPQPFEEAQVELFCAEHKLNKSSQRTYRNRLLKRINEVLLELNAERDPYFQLQNHLCLARIFIRKECFDLAEEELKKAAALESKIGHPASRREIYSLMARKLFQDSLRNMNKQLHAYHEKIRQARTDFNEQVEINLIYQSLFRYGMRRPENQEEWASLKADLEKLSFPERGDIEVQVDYITAWLKLSYFYRDFDEVLKWGKRGIQIFRDKPAYQQQHARYYFTVLDHYLTAISQTRDFDKMWEYIFVMEKVVGTDPLMEANKQSTLIFYELVIYCFDAASRRQLDPDRLADLRIRFDTYKSSFLETRRISINFCFLHLYTLLRDYASAEGFIQQFNLHASEQRRPDLNRVVMLVQTLIKLVDKNKKNDNHKASHLQSTRNNIYNWGNVLPYERIVLRNLGRLLNCPDERREQRAVYEKFREELQELGPDELGQTGAELFTHWLEEELAGS